MQLLRSNGSITQFAWLELADDAVDGQDAVAISYQRYLDQAGYWDARDAVWTVRIEPDADLLELPAAMLKRPELLIDFPSFTDGRGYSHATTLRHRYGYTGDLVAVGDVRRDQLEFMRETGFTVFEITGNDSVEDMQASLVELAMPNKHPLYSGAAQ